MVGRNAHHLLIQNNGVDSLLYTYTDNQGSLIALTDQSGNVVERYAYDPWGVRRNPTNWTQKDTRVKWIVNRGYTGHEHIDAFGIINMNGRVYDPLTSMFLSPDPYVQAPDNWLNYNRYGYCYGNPFKYTDPSGKFIWLLPAIIGGVINWVAHDAKFSWKGLGYFGVGALAGGLGAAVGAGIQMSLSGASFWGGFVGSAEGIAAWTAGSTCFWSGALSGLGGGFAGGFVSGFGNGLLGGQNLEQALGKGFIDGLVGGIAGGIVGGIAGGIDAERSGRDFWEGKPWETIADYSLPKGNLPIHQQVNPEVGCTQETLESIAEYKGQPINVLDKSQGADLAQLAKQYGFDTKTVMPNTENAENLIGAQLNLGNPSAITYNNSGTMHTVGINRIQIQQVQRFFGTGFRTRYLIQVMNPLNNTYETLSRSLFNSGFIRVVK